MLFHLAADKDPGESRTEAWDAFLDSWSEWKRTNGADALDRLHDAIDTLRRVDPDFHFDFPDS